MADKKSDKEISAKSPSNFTKKIQVKWMIWGLVLISVIWVFAMRAINNKPVTERKTIEAAFEDATPGIVSSEEMGMTRMQREMQLLRRQLEEQQEMNTRQQERFEELLDRESRRRALDIEQVQRSNRETSNAAPPPRNRGSSSANDSPDQVSYIRPPREENVVAPPPVRRSDDEEPRELPSRDRTQLPPRITVGEVTQAPSEVAPMPARQIVQRDPDPVFREPADPLVMRHGGPGADGENVFRSSRSIEEGDMRTRISGQIPMGSFADVALITGADFAASSRARGNPQPVLMRVQGDAFLPGKARFELASCFALGSGFGELSAERAYINVTRISCVHQVTGQILEAQVQGYIADSDGRLGMRGVVERRQGAILAKAMIAGFAEGAASILGSAALDTTNQITSGGVISVTDTSASDLSRAGGFAGAGRAAEILADQYIAEAESMFPVIEIDAGRRATMILQVGQRLEWQPLFEDEDNG